MGVVHIGPTRSGLSTPASSDLDPNVRETDDQPMVIDPAVRLTHRRDHVLDGGNDHDLRRGERRGELARVHRGVYAAPDRLATLDVVQRHRVSVEAAAAISPVSVASHQSAAALWGLPLYGSDLRRVHFIRPGSTSGRTRRSRVDHAGILEERDIGTVDGVRTTTVPRTLLDLARTASPETTIVTTDAALQRKLATRSDLEHLIGACRGLPGLGSGRAVLRLADGRSESPGESLARLALHDMATIDSQVTLLDPAGRFVARTDLAVRDALLVIEFDGRQKYLHLRAPGQSIEDAVLSEKRREDAIRALGYLVIRIVWADLANRAELRARVGLALGRGRALFGQGVRAAGSYAPAAEL